MQRKGMRELRKNSRQGVSLVIVLCVSAFFVAFAAAILYTAGLLTSQSTGRLKEERSYLLAQSRQRPHKIQLSGMISARPSFTMMALTSQFRTHL